LTGMIQPFKKGEMDYRYFGLASDKKSSQCSNSSQSAVLSD
jgi:hypothetical protein